MFNVIALRLDHIKGSHRRFRRTTSGGREEREAKAIAFRFSMDSITITDVRRES